MLAEAGGNLGLVLGISLLSVLLYAIKCYKRLFPMKSSICRAFYVKSMKIRHT
jgi:hypothetical protein